MSAASPRGRQRACPPVELDGHVDVLDIPPPPVERRAAAVAVEHEHRVRRPESPSVPLTFSNGSASAPLALLLRR